MKYISIEGARTHNLKNIDVKIPRERLVVITGPSGSGKSSLAFDTLYAEGQRRYVESLSAYARQFLSIMDKPDVDQIEGLSPAIAIDQKSTSHNPRSTVGTITEIYDYLRLLFARAGEPKCPEHDLILEAQSVSQIMDAVLTHPAGSKMIVMAPVVRDRKGTHEKLFDTLRKEGYVRVKINGDIIELDDVPKLRKQQRHSIDVVIDRLKIKDNIRTRLADSIETAFNLADDIVSIEIQVEKKKPQLLTFSGKHACPKCGYSIVELEPKLFSFNSPSGACEECEGLGVSQFFDPELIIRDDINIASGAIRGWDKQNGYYYSRLECLSKHYKFSLDTSFNKLTKKIRDIILYGSEDIIKFKYSNDKGTIFKKEALFEGVLNNYKRRYKETESEIIRDELAKYINESKCPDCDGARLKLEARQVFIKDKNLPTIANFTIKNAQHFFDTLKLKGKREKIAEKILKEISARLQFLMNVGLDYLTLSRNATTLSGGESQRIRLASQIGSALVGVNYVLDEPSIGLHQRDNQKLLQTLLNLRDLGNTVIVVEHDEEAMLAADYLIDMGKGAGVHGGTVVACGTPEKVKQNKESLTGQYLAGKRSIKIPKTRLQPRKENFLSLMGASGNNLKHVNLKIPMGLFTCITGVSGSGKSTLINQTLYPITARALNKATQIFPKAYKKITNLEKLDKVIDIDQSPIGRTPRSNPATYTGLFTPIRELFAATDEARSRGYKPGRFSFNVKGGRCELCEGEGVIKVEMHFLSDLYVICDVCKGKRYNAETLNINYKGRNIFEILEMTVEEACSFFENIPSIYRKLTTLDAVGLGYIGLGQAATTLSGGEAQRIKLAKELSKRDTGQTLYILDEPTTGLHFNDIEQLLHVLEKLKGKGNTIIVIEHNLDVIKTADWVIDLGPEGGDRGGKIIAEGSPETVAKVKESYTGQYLKTMLKK